MDTVHVKKMVMDTNVSRLRQQLAFVCYSADLNHNNGFSKEVNTEYGEPFLWRVTKETISGPRELAYS